MGQWVLVDWDRELAKPETAEELEVELSTLRNKVSPPNTIVNLMSPQGDVLSIGIASSTDRGNESLGPDHAACMNFMNAAQSPPYLKVVGHASLSDDDGLVVFTYEGQWTEIPLRNTVPLDSMLRIAKEFFHSQSLPKWLDWEEV